MRVSDDDLAEAGALGYGEVGIGSDALFLVFLLFIDALRKHTDHRVVEPQGVANLLEGVLMDANRFVDLLIPRLLVQYNG